MSVTIREQPSNEGRRLVQAIRGLQDREVRVGWFAKSKYEDGTPVAVAAVQNEFGNPKKNIPPRPFMRPAVIEHEQDWKKLVEDGAKKVIKQEYTLMKILNLLGSQVEGDVKKQIKKVYYPALAEKTVLARIERNKKLSSITGRIKEATLGNITKPLVDTGIMYNTITHEVL